MDVPIVFTGAQRPQNAMSSDAAFNLTCAVRVAGSLEAIGRGVLVVMSGEIHAASEVSKTENYGLGAFRSDPGGALGSCDGLSVIFRRAVTRNKPAFRWQSSNHWPRVDIVMSYAGSDGALIDAAISAGAKGIVIAGLAPGYATPDQRRALRQARQAGVQVVMSTRAQVGPTQILAQNDVPGLIGSGILKPAKARLLLAAGIMADLSWNDLNGVFQQYV